MEEVVVVRNLHKTYRLLIPRLRVTAVDGVSFVVRRGEVFGLLGPNGSGKTTTLKVILGLLEPTGGEVKVFGRSPTDIEVRRRIGYLPEKTPLWSYLNAWETLSILGSISGLDRDTIRKRAEELFKRLELKAPSRRIGSYSKGMARKVAFAQAILAQPELLILDEPTGGLDPPSAAEVKRILMELKSRGTTMIISSHILAEIQRMCDRVVILADGKIRAEGHLEELLEREGVLRVILKARPQDKERVLSVLEGAGFEVERVESDTVELDTLFLRVLGRDVAGVATGS